MVLAIQVQVLNRLSLFLAGLPLQYNIEKHIKFQSIN